MMLESQVPQDSLVTITVDKVGLITMISAAHKAIKQTNEWNLGDEYDTDITPFHEMKETLRLFNSSTHANKSITLRETLEISAFCISKNTYSQLLIQYWPFDSILMQPTHYEDYLTI